MSVQQEMKRNFQVDIEVLSTHSYTIEEVNSQEEAEEVARQLMEEGDEGDVSGREVFSCDSYPVDSKEEYN